MNKVATLKSLRFVKARQLNTAELKALYYLHDRVAHGLTEMLAQEPSAAAQWQVVGVEQMSFQEMLGKFPRDTVWSILSFGESLVGGVALIIEKEAAISLVRQGGNVGGLAGDNELTEHELTLVDSRFQQFSDAFAQIWGEYHPLSLQLATFPNTPSPEEFSQLLIGMKPDTTIALVSFRVLMVARDVLRVMLMIPQPYLEPLGGVLQSVLESTMAEGDFDQVQERIELVQDVLTPICVELGRAEMTFEELQNLEINDFLRLDQTIDETLIIRIGGETALRGRPGTMPDGKFLAVQVAES
ncbi:MAG: FliM/FliN family flagellar motor switch protein [Candidatus Sericytochromatia bacterium]|nr:FliM/FliN family flagellar motor switch protein [Candidatus Sericytochromatia bacterium]